jgi:predicted outer membrane protein
MMTPSFKMKGLAVTALVLVACSKKESYGTDTTAASSTMSADTSATASSSTTSGMPTSLPY